MSIACKRTEYIIQLTCWHLGGVEPLYCWKRDDDEVVSPLFQTRQCAQAYAEKMPLMTVKEWESRPLPESRYRKCLKESCDA